jgi:hypothetical protein
MSDLGNRFRNARRFEETLDTGVILILRRPTDSEAINYPRGDDVKLPQLAEWAKQFVDGWKITEKQAFGEGSDEVLPWEADAFNEWWSDQGDHWMNIATLILKRFAEAKNKADTESKN